MMEETALRLFDFRAWRNGWLETFLARISFLEQAWQQQGFAIILCVLAGSGTTSKDCGLCGILRATHGRP